MRLIAILSLLLTAAYLSIAQTTTSTAIPHHGNQKTSITQWLGLVSVTITYNSPNVHGPNGEDRKGHIWGEVVKYGLNDPNFGTSKAAPWRAGANEITTISISHDVKINDKPLRAGTYGLMLIVEKDKPWTWIFNRNKTSWGTYYYDPSEDVLRIESKPTEAAYTEWLTFEFEDRELSSATAFLQWENKKVGFKISVPNAIDLYVDQMRAELTSFAGFNAMNWFKSARFCINNNTNLDEALEWVDIAMDEQRFHRQKTFSGMQTKAEILSLLNRNDEAEKVIAEALTLNPSVTELNDYANSLLTKGENQKAIEMFKRNRKQHPEDNFFTFLGLAKAFGTVGNKKEAIKNWMVVLKNIPDSQIENKPVYEAELMKLRGQ